MLSLPTTAERVLSKVEAGQLQVRFAEDGRNGTSRGPATRGQRSPVRHSSSGFATLVIGVAGLAAGVVLALNQLMIPSWFCLGLGGLAALSLLFRR
jgi:hypothetical protein